MPIIEKGDAKGKRHYSQRKKVKEEKRKSEEVLKRREGKGERLENPAEKEMPKKEKATG